MSSLRKMLLPFGLLYGGITAVRNRLFDNGILRSTEFDVPIIAVGNLSVGGTGKTPMIEYLVRLLKDSNVAVLSRGYGRRTKGYILVTDKQNALTVGDEPFQYHLKFPELRVAVDENRCHGISKLMHDPTDVILLDDAFQHRKVRAGLYILLTAYGDLYTDDLILPAGNLRESVNGAQRADIIIVTKCPKDITPEQRSGIVKKIRPAEHQRVFFTTVEYDANFSGATRDEFSCAKVIVAGIAKPQPFIDHVRNVDDTVLIFADHHHFSDTDIDMILATADGRPIVTTEKDFTRLKGRIPESQLFYVAIRTRFVLDGAEFDMRILAFVTPAPDAQYSGK